MGVIYRFPNLAPSLTPQSAFQTDYYDAPGTVQTESLLTALEADVSLEESLIILRQCFQMRSCPAGDRRYDLLRFPRGVISRSRIGRQKAAVVIPDEVKKAVSINVGHPITSLPSIAPNLWDCQQSIEDLHYRSDVQCFYFRHSRHDPTPHLNAEHLWPNDGDYFLLAIAYLFVSGLGFHVHPSFILPQRLDLIDPGHGHIATDKLAASAEQYLSRCDELALSQSLAPHFSKTDNLLFYIHKAGILSYRGHVTADGTAIEQALKHCQVAREFDRTSITLIALEMLLNEAMGRHSNMTALTEEALNILVEEGYSDSEAFQSFKATYLSLYTKRFSQDFAYYFYELFQST